MGMGRSWGQMSWVGGSVVLGVYLLVEGTKPGLWAPALVAELIYSHLDKKRDRPMSRKSGITLAKKNSVKCLLLFIIFPKYPIKYTSTIVIFLILLNIFSSNNTNNNNNYYFIVILIYKSLIFLP